MRRISILLRTRNEACALPATLAAIRGQQCAAEVECVVVDSGSTDGTLDVARRWQVEHILRLPPAEFSYGRALNQAARQATGDVLVLLSAHARPADRSWLECLTSPLGDERVGGVFGRQAPPPDAWPPVVVDYRRAYGDAPCRYGREADSDTPTVLFSNANAALRRSLWAELPFDETLPACEDQDWARRALARGYELVYEPRAAVYHAHNEGLWQVYRRRAREERGWRLILPRRHVSWREFLEMWVESSRVDLGYVVAQRGPWRWLLAAPLYRLCWAFGQWRP